MFCPWNSPGKNTGAGCHFLLQGIILTQGLNSHLPKLLHCRQMFFFFSYNGWATGEVLPVSRPSSIPFKKKNQPFWFSLIGKKWYLCTFYIWTVLSGGLTILTLHGNYVFVAISSNCYFHSIKSCIQVDVCWLISFRNIIYWVLLQYVRIELTVSSVLYVFSLSNLLSFLFHLWKEYSWLSTYGSDMFSFKIDFVFLEQF